MAFTLDQEFVGVHGNQRFWQGVITADAATGVVSFGLKSIHHVQATPKSAASTTINFKRDELADGTASAGDLAITGCTSGDDFYVMVYGV